MQQLCMIPVSTGTAAMNRPVDTIRVWSFSSIVSHLVIIIDYMRDACTLYITMMGGGRRDKTIHCLGRYITHIKASIPIKNAHFWQEI